jgi:hypothetical protein
MNIGLYDADMQTYIHVPFNLELMKISSYYKRHNHLVTFMHNLRPDLYGSVFYFKDYFDGIYPAEVTDSNVVPVGLSFTSNKYQPQLTDIELSTPDVFIYEGLRGKFSTDPFYASKFTTLTNAVHARLSLDGKTIWKDWTKPFFSANNQYLSLFIHDFDVGSLERAPETIAMGLDYLRDTYPNQRIHRVGTKFPICVNNDEQFLKWIAFDTLNEFFPLEYRGVMQDSTFHQFVQAKVRTNTSAQFVYYIDYYMTDFQRFLKEDLPKVYMQLLHMHFHGKKIQIKYTPNKYVDERWCRLFELWNCFSGSFPNRNFAHGEIETERYYHNLYAYVKILNHEIKKRTILYPHLPRFTLRENIDLFDMVKQENYELFKLFYNASYAIYEKGELFPCQGLCQKK